MVPACIAASVPLNKPFRFAQFVSRHMVPACIAASVPLNSTQCVRHGQVTALSKKSPYVQTTHRISGLMLASHTSIRHIFSKCLSQYDKLRKKQAFLYNYRKFPMFADNDLSEFDEPRDIIESLVDEYKACESPD